MLKRRLIGLAGIVALSALGAARAAAQQIVDEALSSFPPQIARLEYSDVDRLRELPNYRALRQRYLGSGLQDLERSLAALGVSEGDVSELVLGWQTSSAGRSGNRGLCGLVRGHFSIEKVAGAAAAAGLRPVFVSGNPAYCVDSQGGTCAIIFDSQTGAFGNLSQLSFMTAARSGMAGDRSPNNDLAELIRQTAPHSPLWGAFKSPAITGWLNESMSNLGVPKLDWGLLSSGVDTLIYTIDVESPIHIEMRFGCKSLAAGAALYAALDAFSLVQDLAWRRASPGLANPLERVEISSYDGGIEAIIEANPGPL